MPERRDSAQSVYVKEKTYLYCVAKLEMKFIVKRMEWWATDEAALAADSTDQSLHDSGDWILKKNGEKSLPYLI